MYRAAEERDRAVDEELSAIPADLYRKCEDSVLPPAVADPEVLPFAARSPRDFERCCLLIAERADGLRHARLYGTPGQNQDGIDLYGYDDAGAVVHQVKRYQSFGPGDLRAAVDRFRRGRRPFRPHRFVVCVSSVTDRTAIATELDLLRSEVDFEVDLYDAVELSEKLRGRHDVVERLFGPDWVRVFNRREVQDPPSIPATDQLADRVLRGPLETLGLQATLDGADQARSAGDLPAATAALEQVIEGLVANGFGGLAKRLRHQLADDLIEDGQDATAAIALARLVWESLETDPLHPDRHALHQLDRHPSGHGSLQRCLDAMHSWFESPGDSVIELMPDVLIAGSGPLGDEIVLWFAETAVACRDDASSHELVRPLSALVDRRFNTHPRSDILSVRARCVIADCTGEWTVLTREARQGTLGPGGASLAHARRARSEAWTGEPIESHDHYREAVQPACTAHFGADAAHALLSAENVLARYGHIRQQTFDVGFLSAPLRGAGGTFHQYTRDFEDVALAQLQGGHHAEALRAARAALRKAVICGHFDAELNAHDTLAQVLAHSGVPGSALRHAILAGNKDLALRLPVVHTGPPSAFDAVPWSHAVALASTAATADLLPDGAVEACATWALNSLDAPSRAIGPQIDRNAMRLLATLAERFDEGTARAALAKLEPLVSRDPRVSRWTDEDHIQTLHGIYDSQPSLRPRALAQLLDLLASGDQVAVKVIDELGELLFVERNTFLPVLSVLAEDGHRRAIERLVQLEAPTDAVLRTAGDAALMALERSTPEPGTVVIGIGTPLPHQALLTRVTDEDTRTAVGHRCVEDGEDATRASVERIESLEALRNLAEHLPERTRHELYERCMALADQESGSSGHVFDRLVADSTHPLARFTLNMNFGDVPTAAALTAAKLAATDAQRKEVVDRLVPRLFVSDPTIANETALGLYYLELKRSPTDLVLLLESPHKRVRQLAAIWWSNFDHRPELGRRLARDVDPGVRAALGRQLDSLAIADADLAAELAATLLADPSAMVRRNSQLHRP